MLKKIAVVVGVLVAALLVYAATKPDSFTVQRSLSIKAPAEKIYPHIANFHAWAAWSPYDKKDPEIKRTFSGAEAGVGAKYAWEGNSQVGAGHMEMTEAAPTHVVVDLNFTKPFEGHDVADFTLEPQADSTKVIWAMHGPSPYISKLMSTFFNMDKMIGSDFEVGLDNLKVLAER